MMIGIKHFVAAVFYVTLVVWRVPADYEHWTLAVVGAWILSDLAPISKGDPLKLRSLDTFWRAHH
jgi:hypothetical protein